MSKLRGFSKSVATVQKFVYQINCTHYNSWWSIPLLSKATLLSIRDCKQFKRSLSFSIHRLTFVNREHTRDPEIKACTTQNFDKDQEPLHVHKMEVPLRNYNHSLSHSHDSVPPKNDDQLTSQPEIEEYDYYSEEPEISSMAPPKHIPISLQRGLSGVFDVEEIVKVLEDENGIDIRVLDIPPEIRFVDHMVIVSGKSLRHMKAMVATVEYLYKKKQWSTDRQFKLEGRDCKDWFAMDLGNIVVHIFNPEARQRYDLETLWTLGPEHDDSRHYVQDKNLNLTAEELFWLESGWSSSSKDILKDAEKYNPK